MSVDTKRQDKKAKLTTPAPTQGERMAPEWSAPLRMERSGEAEKNSQRLILAALAGSQSHKWPLTGDDFRKPSLDSIIDQFIEVGEHKVVANDQTPDDIVMAPSDEGGTKEEFVSEQLAEIFVSQGLTERAIETYRKLSLLYPKKSIYFAEHIEKLKEKEITIKK